MPPAMIDVLIPVYNGAATLRSSIASIQAQSVADIRMVIVDDGSTDSTPTILAELAAQDGRLRIVTKPNGGIVDALNTGLRQCTAPLIARHDADDLAYPERFAAQLTHFARHPECIALSCGARHIDAAGVPTGVWAEPKALERADPTWAPCREPYLLHPFLMLRKSAIDAVGGYRDVQASEDSDLYWRLQEIGMLHNAADVLGDYRMHADSISSKSIRNGRRMSLGSQLAGLSALRRRAGEPDLRFDQARRDAIAEAVTLEDFYRGGSVGLNAHESRRLRIGMSAKLLELASYRPFELEGEDCRFIRQAFAACGDLLVPRNRFEFECDLIDASRRLLKQGKYREGLMLSPPRLLARLTWNTLDLKRRIARLTSPRLTKRQTRNDTDG